MMPMAIRGSIKGKSAVSTVHSLFGFPSYLPHFRSLRWGVLVPPLVCGTVGSIVSVFQLASRDPISKYLVYVITGLKDYPTCLPAFPSHREKLCLDILLPRNILNFHIRKTGGTECCDNLRTGSHNGNSCSEIHGGQILYLVYVSKESTDRRERGGLGGR